MVRTHHGAKLGTKSWLPFRTCKDSQSGQRLSELMGFCDYARISTNGKDTRLGRSETKAGYVLSTFG